MANEGKEQELDPKKIVEAVERLLRDIQGTNIDAPDQHPPRGQRSTDDDDYVQGHA